MGLIVIIFAIGIVIVIILVKYRSSQHVKSVSSQQLVTHDTPMTEYNFLPPQSSQNNLLAMETQDSLRMSSQHLFSYEIELKDIKLLEMIGLYWRWESSDDIRFGFLW